MRTSALLAVSLVACAGAQRPVPKAEAESPTLQRLVLAGIAGSYRDECHAGPLWAPVDDPEAGRRLDAILNALSSKEKPTSRERVCVHTLASARLVRLARIGALDVEAELRYPLPAARRVALRYVALADLRELAPQVRPLLHDADRGVVAEARETVVALNDRGAIPELLEMAAHRQEHDLSACSTLWKLGEKLACGGEPKEGLGSIGVGGGRTTDPCDEAHASIAASDEKKQATGLLFLLHRRFDRIGNRFDAWRVHLGDAQEPKQCPLDPATRDSLLASASPVLRALVAAIILWERHPEVPATR